MMNIMVHSTYHPFLTGGSFIVDKTQVQYAKWPTLGYRIIFIPEDHVRTITNGSPWLLTGIKLKYINM